MCMYKKYICLISVILLLGVVGNALAVDIDWTNGGGDRLWRNAANWNFGVPAAADKAAIRQGGVGPIIDSSTSAVAANVVLGDWTSPADTLDMTGGSLTTSDWFILGYGVTNNGTFTIGAGTASVGTNLFVGFGGDGQINMTAGTITIGSTLGIAQMAGSSGNVYLNGGIISCGSLSMLNAAAMDIAGGTLIVNGNVTLTINSYISSGLLTGYGGSGTLAVDYNITSPGKTTVTANSPEKASYPFPANGITGVSINADFSWIAGAYAVSHDVYFGTDPTPDETEFMGNRTSATFDPGTMSMASTYYWRIDEVDTGNPASPWTGDVWSFTTQTSTATLKKGPYLIYPDNNTQMQVLWQLDNNVICSLAWGLDTTYADGNVSVSEYGTDHQYQHVIDGLTPGATYCYKVTIGTGASAGTFRAAPADSITDVKFLMYGDTRTNPADHSIVCAGMNSVINSDPAYQTMLLLAGDWVGAGDSEVDWTTQFFNRSYPASILTQSTVPIAGSRGNHEQTATGYRKYWPYPYVNSCYWSFDYGPMHITVIDQYIDYSTGSAQHNWLVNDLSTSNKDWKIIILHEPGWTSKGGHVNNGNVQDYIQPLCVQYGVQIVLGGHNHYYARAVVDEVHHLTSGGGGAPLYGPKAGEPYIVSSIESLNYQTVEISGDIMYVTSFQPNGTVIDIFQTSYLPCVAGTVHVHSIDCETVSCSPPNECGQVMVTVTNNCGAPVAGADVTGTFTGEVTGQSTETTNSSGVAILTSTTMVKKPIYVFCVNNIVDPTLSYESADNIEFCDTNGTEPVSELPGQASDPGPADSATSVSTTADLSWTAGADATSHDVYFGTSSPGAFQGNQTGTTFDTGTMDESTIYYWRIDEKGDFGTTAGVVWSFITHSICGDEICDQTDLAMLVSHWLDTGCVDPTWCDKTDFDKSGDVGMGDIIILAENWLKDFLLIHWNLDETAGDVAHDASINAYHGTLMNMDDSDWIAGVNGNALDFDGVNDYVAINNVFTGMAGKDITMSAWIKAAALNPATQFIISINTPSGGNNMLFGTRANTATISFGDTVWHDTAATVIDNTWHHIAYVLEDSSDTITIYVDGSNVLSFTSTVSVAATDILSFGQEYDPGMVTSDFYSGQIDDVRIYDRALSQAQIEDLTALGD